MFLFTALTESLDAILLGWRYHRRSSVVWARSSPESQLMVSWLSRTVHLGILVIVYFENPLLFQDFIDFFPDLSWHSDRHMESLREQYRHVIRLLDHRNVALFTIDSGGKRTIWSPRFCVLPCALQHLHDHNSKVFRGLAEAEVDNRVLSLNHDGQNRLFDSRERRSRRMISMSCHVVVAWEGEEGGSPGTTRIDRKWETRSAMFYLHRRRGVSCNRKEKVCSLTSVPPS